MSDATVAAAEAGCPCEYVPEPAVPLMQHGPEVEPPKFKPQPAERCSMCRGGADDAR